VSPLSARSLDFDEQLEPGSRRARAGARGVPVLFMSGYDADAIATRGVLEAGISVVEKPFTSADLLSKVRELLPSS
jgi:DNA-binding response OmpR family regulator